MPVWSYLVAIPVFGLLILVHEIGHYLAARWAGIAVTEFSVGMGPRLLGRSWRGTQWNLRLLPFGGYVRWEEEGPSSFVAAAPGWRALALFGGPVANLGLTLALILILLAGFRGAGLEAIPSALRAVGYMTAGWVSALSGLLAGRGIEDLSGPVGIVQATAAVTASGPEDLIVFTAFLSLNVGLFNLLPIPGLDGGRLLFVAIERVLRRPVAQHVEGWIHAGGFLLLLGLLVMTMIKDLVA